MSDEQSEQTATATPPVRTSTKAKAAASRTASVAAGTDEGSETSSAARDGEAPRPTGARRVRLSVSRIDPWSTMKLSFLLAVAAGIAGVVATAVAWYVLNSMGVFADLETLVEELQAQAQFATILEYLRFRNIVSLAAIIAVVNVALMTAIATLGAFLYNIVAAMVGGLHLTLTDD